MTKEKVLLTASYGPNDLAWGQDQYDLLTSRLARGHGPFQMTSHCHYFALYLIAENITHPTTVLENPHLDEFEKELDEGYGVVGFQLKSLHTKKIARMMKLVREKSPGTKIVVGGYGVNSLASPVPGDKNGDAVYVRENADHLCREEGVRFMRKILGDEPIDREVTQYHMPTTGFSVSGFDAQARIPIILVSLGCPNACDFCNTSAMFNYKKIRVATAEQVYRFMKNYQKRLKTQDIVVILFDEDIFIDQEFVRELGRLLRSSRDTWGIKWFSFGSMRSLSNFTAEELRDCGLGSVWIGVESFLCGENLTTDQYQKRGGKEIKEMFADLHRHGIQTVGSLVLGFDFHTPENLKEDIDQFVALKPTLYQLSPLTPCPGTALYDRMLEEGRILDSYKWEDFNLWKDDVFELKHFKPGQIKELYDYAHEKIRDELGPQPLQLLESVLDSYQSLKDSTDEFHTFLAAKARRFASGGVSYLRSVEKHHHSRTVRDRARMLKQRYLNEIGKQSLLSKGVSLYLSSKIRRKSKASPSEIVSDPPPRWSYYNMFDKRVWVKKGREVKDPEPYKDRGMLARVKLVKDAP